MKQSEKYCQEMNDEIHEKTVSIKKDKFFFVLDYVSHVIWKKKEKINETLFHSILFPNIITFLNI